MALPKLETPKHSCVLPITNNTVYYRPFLIGEQKILLIAQESEDEGQVIREMINLLDTCCDDMNAANLNTIDLENLFLQLRMKSVGETADIVLHCERCDIENQVTVELEKVDVPNKDQMVDPNVKITDNVIMEFQYPTYKILEQVTISEDLQTEELFKLISKCVVSITNGDEVHSRDDFTEKELNTFIESMSVDMFENVNKFFNSLPKLVIDFQYKCSSCEHQNSTVLEGLGSFFG